MAELQIWEEIVKHKERKKIIIIASVVAICILLLLGTYKTMGYSETSDFCNKCHGDDPYHATWAQSSHSDVSCYKCHFSPTKKVEVAPTTMTQQKYWTINLGNKKINVSQQMKWIKDKAILFNRYVDVAKIQIAYMKNKLTYFGQIFIMMTGGREDGPAITWNNCSGCHSDIVPSNSSADSAAHATHARIGLSCDKCHGDVVHIDVVKIERTDCTRCHASGPPKPPSHSNAAAFKLVHGQKFLKENSCRICHTKGSREKLCMDCHGVEMPHQESYPKIHVQQIKEVGIKKCRNCHKDGTNGSGSESISNTGSFETGGTVWSDEYLKKKESQIENLTKSKATEAKQETSCSKCHGNNLLHSASKALVEHGQQALKSTTGCYSCHKTNECVNCHGMAMPHPKSFPAQHGGIVKQSGVEKCNSCHVSGTGNIPSCDSCHGMAMPHPSEFLDNHWQQDMSKCNNCHSQKNPANPKGKAAAKDFCQKCHNVQEHYEGHWERYEQACLKCHVNRMGCKECH